MSNVFSPATRKAVKLKIAIQGPSGSGKTLGALALAQGLASGGKIAVIDTENGSASLYADRYSFDTLDLRPPYTSARYLDAITAAAEAGYTVVVIDSLSHEWVGEGSILSRKEGDDARPGANSYTNWAKYTKEHEGFKAGILAAPIHVIATMRAKQDYILETNEKGKQQPRKIGLAPIQREGMEYEFTTVWEVQMTHRATTSKDRTGLFGDEPVDLLSPALPKRLLEWLGSAVMERGGAESPSHAGVASKGTPAPTLRITEEDVFPTRDTPWPGSGPVQGKTVREWAKNQLLAVDDGTVKVPDEWLSIVRLELKARAAKAAAG